MWLPLIGVLAGCGPESARHTGPRPITVTATYQGAYPIKVLATTGMVADLVQHVGKGHVEVTQLIPAGEDPHLFPASARDAQKFTDADIIFYSGRNLEGKLTQTLERMASTKPVFAVTDYIADDAALADEDGHPDPHMWFDTRLWSQTVPVVRDGLSAFDPAHKEDYHRNADEYEAQLRSLDLEMEKELHQVPLPQRKLVTAHDAFRYFGKRYGYEVNGIQGISTESQPGVRRINELVNYIADHNIKAVFVETSVPEKAVEALKEGCQKQRNHPVVVGGELYSDSMAKDGTYEEMIRHNVKTIVAALR